jgi:hypothetical protein
LGWTFLLCTASVAHGANRLTHDGDIPLIKLALARFPNLTRAERTLLEYADINTIDRGESAVAGTSSDRDDSSNDPAHAAAWGHEREIRSELIRWLCSNPNASRLEDPGGIRILGARIVGDFDLSYRRIPFPIVMHRCKFSNQIKLVATEIPHLDLDGSYVGEINAKGLIAHSDLNLGHGFQAEGETMLENAKVEGDLDCSGGSFKRSATAMESAGNLYHPALEASGSTIVGTAFLCCGFHAEGAVALWGTSVGGGLLLFGARLSNPGTLALIGN